MRVAKDKGQLRGKQPKLSPRQEAHLVELIRSGEHTTSEVGDLFGVARSTVNNRPEVVKLSVLSFTLDADNSFC